MKRAFAGASPGSGPSPGVRRSACQREAEVESPGRTEQAPSVGFGYNRRIPARQRPLGVAFAHLLRGALAIAAATLVGASPAVAQTAKSAAAAEIDRAADRVLKELYASEPSARSLARKATAVLVFPEIVKGGLMVGAQYGKGALRKRGRTVAYYETVAGSYGLQVGVQKFGYAMFFMNEAALGYLDRSEGWEVGVGPSVVVVDTGAAKAMTTTTMQDDIYAFIFDQKGLMAGVGIQGSKITRIQP